MIVVDAGPGTGKTHTIVERYIRMISRQDISPKDVLLLTFTNNAAAEMEERIKKRMSELGMEKESKLVLAKTFDAFCLSIVLDSPDMISSFFDFPERLTRAAIMHENESLNRDYFVRFLDSFLNDRGADYGDIAVIASQNADSLMDLISNLMSKGLIPQRSGWFGNNWDRILEGDTEAVIRKLNENNDVSSKGNTANSSKLGKIGKDDSYLLPELLPDNVLSDDDIRRVAFDDRATLFRFVHDVYYAYIRHSVSDNRLTFNLVSVFAFTVLYRNASVRQRNSFNYLMVDEFQDTNANQLMIALMIMKEPNLCVVGDWKQGIYGFRYVSIENITEFEERTVEYRRFLNQGGEKRVPFSIPEKISLPLDVNYRSPQNIIDLAFECIYLKGSEADDVKRDELESKVVKITADDDKHGHTDIRFVQSDSKEGEVEDTIRAIKDYVFSDCYSIWDGKEKRRVGFGDIAVICRNTESCRRIRDACQDQGIPAYLQGDVQIMSTREGKLALAWLRFVNNDKDPWAIVPIMSDMDYPPVRIERASKDHRAIPEILLRQR